MKQYVILKNIVTPFRSAKKGEVASAQVWAGHFGISEDSFLRRFNNGELNEWFIRENPLTNKQTTLYFQFGDDEPVEIVTCNGKTFTIEIAQKNGYVEFTDGEKKFKLFIK